MKLMSSPALLQSSMQLSRREQRAEEPKDKVRRKSDNEKLAGLCEEIEEAIRVIGVDDDVDDDHRIAIGAALEGIRERAFRERVTPQFTYASLLFRKYKEIVNGKYLGGHNGDDEMSYYSHNHEVTDDFFLAVTSGCSTIGLGGVGATLHGESAKKSSILKLRCAVGVLSAVAFIVFVSSRHFTHMHMDVSAFFRDRQECKSIAANMSGSFGLIFFHLGAACAFFLASYSATVAFYYVQPLDSTTGQKVLPGLATLVRGVSDGSNNWQNRLRRSADWVHQNGKTAEFAVDVVLLVATLLSSVCSSLSLANGSRFQVGAEVQYYTMTSLFRTYSTNTLCVVEGGDPSTSLRVGLALTYLSLFGLALCCRFSYSSYRIMMKHRQREMSLSLAYGVSVHSTTADAGRSPLLSPPRKSRGGGGGIDIDSSDSELDVVLDSVQSELSFHGDSGDYGNDDDDDDSMEEFV
jgi:hypothetical protein